MEKVYERLFAVTGIRYCCRDAAAEKGVVMSEDDMYRAAEAFTGSCLRGCRFILTMERGIEWDGWAVAVYDEFFHLRGYISHSERMAVVEEMERLGTRSMWAEAAEDGSNVTLYVRLVEDTGWRPLAKERRIAETLVPEDVMVWFTRDGNRAELVGSCMRWMTANCDKVSEWSKMMKIYTSICEGSDCWEDGVTRSVVFDFLKSKTTGAHDSASGMKKGHRADLISESDRKKWKEMAERMDEVMRRMHKVDVHGEVMEREMEGIKSAERRYRESEEAREREQSFVVKYALWRFGHDVVECLPQERKVAAEELLAWLRGIKSDLFRNGACSAKDVAHRLYGMELTRREVYDVEQAMILIEVLNEWEHLRPKANFLKLPGKIRAEEVRVYWDRLVEAGILTEGYMLGPNTSRRDAALIIDLFGELTEIGSKWKYFEEFWGIRNLRQSKHNKVENGHSSKNEEVITSIFDE